MVIDANLRAADTRERLLFPIGASVAHRIGFFVVDALTVTCPACWPDFVLVDPSRSVHGSGADRACPIGRSIHHRKQNDHPVSCSDKSSSRKRHIISRVLTLLRNIRRLFAVEISSQRMERWR